MRWGRLRPWISVAVGMLVVGLGAWYVVSHWEDFTVLGRLDPLSLLGIVGTVIVYLVLGGVLLNTFLRRYSLVLPWYRWLGLYVTMSVGNILAPLRGGTGMGAAYLRLAHGMKVSRFALVLLGTSVAAALVNAVLAMVGMGLSYARSGWFNLPAVIAAGLVLAAGGVTLIIPNPAPSQRWGWKVVVKALNGWNALIQDRRLLAKVLLITLALNLVHAGTFLLIYRALGLAVGPEVVLTIVSLGTVASMVALTPASLGPYDAVLIALPTTFGLTVSEALAALLVFRGAMLATTLALAGPLSFTVWSPGSSGPPSSPDA